MKKKGWFGDSARHSLSAFGIRTKHRRNMSSKTKVYPKHGDPTDVSMKELFSKGYFVKEYLPDASFERLGKFKTIEEWKYDGYLYTIAVRSNGSTRLVGVVVEV